MVKFFTTFGTMTKKPPILFFYNRISFYFPQRNKLKTFLIDMARTEGYKIHEIRIVFCDNKTVRDINRTFLKHDYDTDIITFPFSEKDQPLEAELYINIPQIKKQAKEWGCTFKQELHRIILHGLLHLCGYNDKTGQEKKEIRLKEDHYLAKYL
jgi:probable rRNA maturation factor